MVLGALPSCLAPGCQVIRAGEQWRMYERLILKKAAGNEKSELIGFYTWKVLLQWVVYL